MSLDEGGPFYDMAAPPLGSMHQFHAAVPMTQMSSFAPAPLLHLHAQAPPHSTTDRARAYKSRNKRPCDFCRYKKAACHLDTHPPCELCIRYNKECTFVESPAKRRRPNDESEDTPNKRRSTDAYSNHERNGRVSSHEPFANLIHVNGGIDMQPDLLPWDNGMPPFHMSMGMPNDLPPPDFPLDPAFYQDATLGAFDAFDPLSIPVSVHPMESTLVSVQSQNPIAAMESPPRSVPQLSATFALPFEATGVEPSWDLQSSSSAQLVGLSGESDPYLLSRYHYDVNNEAALSSLRIRKMDNALGPNGRIPAFFTIQHDSIPSNAQQLDDSGGSERQRRDIKEMVSEDVGTRLIRLFHKFVHPYFPILVRKSPSSSSAEEDIREPGSLPTCLLAAIYGHAIPFCRRDDRLRAEKYTPPSVDVIFKVAWLACVSEFHTPSLATLQTLLLLVQRRPLNNHVSDTPLKGVIMAAAISIAQSLGLNRDPTDWPLPPWEIKLRRRLAWAVFVQDKWLALNSGRPSLLQADDWDVIPLSRDDFAEPDAGPEDSLDFSQSITFRSQHFMHLCELTQIADDVLRSLFSIKATKSLQNGLEATLEVAKPLRLRLTEWYQSLPTTLLMQPAPHTVTSNNRKGANSQNLDGKGSLHLAYITAKIELFRAMLRPKPTESNIAAFTVLRTGAVAVAKEVVDFLERLHARELEAFWASYARTNFTIATSFLLLLYVTSPSVVDAKECLTLLDTWRSLLRVKSRNCDLLDLALLRLDGVWVAGIDRLMELSPAALAVWEEGEHGKG